MRWYTQGAHCPSTDLFSRPLLRTAGADWPVILPRNMMALAASTTIASFVRWCSISGTPRLSVPGISACHVPELMMSTCHLEWKRALSRYAQVCTSFTTHQSVLFRDIQPVHNSVVVRQQNHGGRRAGARTDFTVIPVHSSTPSVSDSKPAPRRMHTLSGSHVLHVYTGFS